MDEVIFAQIDALIVPGEHWVSALSNVSAAIMQLLPRLNWAGFYLRTEEPEGPALLLGPFQGLPACVHIPFGKGVCGTAAAQDHTVVVPDVHAFPGHIACDGASRSEIVVPMHDGSGNVCGVMDIDSPEYDRFTLADRQLLERCVSVLQERINLHGVQ